MHNFEQTFKTKYPLIGALHLPPLIGFEGFTSYEQVLEFSLKNAKTLEQAGFDSIIVENNYDLPHKITVSRNTVDMMTQLTSAIVNLVSIPVGVSVLWNSYREGLEIAKNSGAVYIRVPVFVDSVETSYGTITGDAADVTNFRNEIEAQNVLLLTDIQVKHSKLLNVRPIGEAAQDAIDNGSDCLIVTGKWTGDAPNTDDLKKVRHASGEFPFVIGSGATVDNLETLMNYADGVIVGTALKDAELLSKEEEVNLVKYNVPISLELSKQFSQKYSEVIKEKKAN